MAIDVKGESLVLKRVVSDFPDWRTMQGMVNTGPSLTQALKEEHRAEIERDDDAGVPCPAAIAANPSGCAL